MNARNAGTLHDHAIVKGTISLENRLLEKLLKEEGKCWPWQGNVNGDGYGMIWKERKHVRAHREAYSLWVGTLSDDEIVCHTCDNPPCCNPAHLFKGTRDDNNKDTAAKWHFPLGKKHHATKLTNEEVKFIRGCDASLAELANVFSVNPSTISRIKTGARRSKLA